MFRLIYTYAVDGIPCCAYYVCLAVGNSIFYGRSEVSRFVSISVTVIIEAEIVKDSPVVRNYFFFADSDGDRLPVLRYVE